MHYTYVTQYVGWYLPSSLLFFSLPEADWEESRSGKSGTEKEEEEEEKQGRDVGSSSCCFPSFSLSFFLSLSLSGRTSTTGVPDSGASIPHTLYIPVHISSTYCVVYILVLAVMVGSARIVKRGENVHTTVVRN